MTSSGYNFRQYVHTIGAKAAVRFTYLEWINTIYRSAVTKRRGSSQRGSCNVTWLAYKSQLSQAGETII